MDDSFEAIIHFIFCRVRLYFRVEFGILKLKRNGLDRVKEFI